MFSTETCFGMQNNTFKSCDQRIFDLVTSPPSSITECVRQSSSGHRGTCERVCSKKYYTPYQTPCRRPRLRPALSHPDLRRQSSLANLAGAERPYRRDTCCLHWCRTLFSLRLELFASGGGGADKGGRRAWILELRLKFAFRFNPRRSKKMVNDGGVMDKVFCREGAFVEGDVCVNERVLHAPFLLHAVCSESRKTSVPRALVPCNQLGNSVQNTYQRSHVLPHEPSSVRNPKLLHGLSAFVGPPL